MLSLELNISGLELNILSSELNISTLTQYIEL